MILITWGSYTIITDVSYSQLLLYPSALLPEGHGGVVMGCWLQLSLPESWHDHSVCLRRDSSGRTPRSCSFTVQCPDGQQLLLQSIFHHRVKGARERDNGADSFSSALMFSARGCQWENVWIEYRACSVLSSTVLPKQKLGVEKNLGPTTPTGSWPGCTNRNKWRSKSSCTVLKVSIKMK